MNSDGAAVRALSSLGPQTWQVLIEPLVVEGRISVTSHQWSNVVADSGLLASMEEVWVAVRRVHLAAAEAEQAVGRTLRPAVASLIEDVRDLRVAAADVLWFVPPARDGPAAVQRHVSRHCMYVVDLLNQLASGGSCPPNPQTQQELTLADFDAAPTDEDDDDPAARVYGIASQDLPPLGSPIATRLRAAFRHRADERDAITGRIISYALDGRAVSEQLDGTVHVWALAADAHPIAAHRAARAACELVIRRAANDIHTTALAILEGFEAEQDGYSSHRAHSRARRALAAAEDPDDYTRAAADVYRIITEGPLRQAAAAVLRLIDQPVPTTAGLNDIRSRLLAQASETPLCRMIGMLIVPAWRNPSAHEHMHWDPDVGAAMLGGRPVDLDDVLDAADLAWATARGFQAGVTIGRACVPQLGQTIDALERNPTPVRRDFRLIKFLDEPQLDLDVYDVWRDPAGVTIALDPIQGPDRLMRIGAALVGLTQLEPAVERWVIKFAGNWLGSPK